MGFQEFQQSDQPRLHALLAVLALACRYTPAVVLQWGAAVSHGTTNDFNVQQVEGYRDMLAEIDRSNIGELTKMLDLMDSYDEGGGRTLLDDTVTLYSNEFSNGQGHTTGDLPYTIIGGAGYFKLGQSLLVDGGEANNAGARRGSSNKLLATVLNAGVWPRRSSATARQANSPSSEPDSTASRGEDAVEELQRDPLSPSAVCHPREGSRRR